MSKKQGNKYKAQSWLGACGLADQVQWVSGQGKYSQGHKSYLNFGLLTWHTGRATPSQVGKLIPTLCANLLNYKLID